MPLVNTYYSTDEQEAALRTKAKELKQYFAEVLSVDELSLNPDEITIRLLKTLPDGMIADIEIEMIAHSFADRVRNQDKICLQVREDLLKRFDVNDIRVWLVLSELGHSWEL